MKKYILFTVLLLTVIYCNSQNSTKNKEQPVKYLGSKTPYFPNKELSTKVPDSLKPVAIAMIARHGSRYMSSPDEDIALLTLLTKAKQKKQLTKTGKQLFKSISLLTEIQNNNYGNLSIKGLEEHQILGSTLGKEYSKLLSHSKIQANSTYKQRTKDSRASFLTALSKEINTPINIVRYNNPKGKDSLLRFYKTNKSYILYKEKAEFKKQYNRIKNSLCFQKTTKRIIHQLFKKKYADSLLKDNFKPIYNEEGEITIENSSDIIIALYECYKISEGLYKEGADSFRSYFIKNDLEELSYMSSIESFYEKAIGYPDTNITYSIASPLLKEFLVKIDHSLKTNSNLVYLNFAHAETIGPFAVLTGLQSKVEPQEVLPRDYFNESELIKMGSNIQWILYVSKNKKNYIKILYNAKEINLPLTSYGTAIYLWDDVFIFYKNTLAKLNS